MLCLSRLFAKTRKLDKNIATTDIQIYMVIAQAARKQLYKRTE